ncbi:MAG: hypothetical protein MI742_18290 [Desulfobacterales bacterium]|nr:hypothetical protein [Desulfobacterales bacterium]
MYLLMVVVQNEETADELITGFMDLGVSASAVVEATDGLEVISHHVPLFAGFRMMAGSGMTRGRALFAQVENDRLLSRLKTLMKRTLSQARDERGFYAVLPLVDGGDLSSLT